MPHQRSFLAIDLGAESGRAILGRLSGDLLRTDEVYRFANEPVRMRDTIYWDLPRLWRDVLEGIRRGAGAAGGQLDGIGVDSWGVDFGLLDRTGELLANPVHYRDARTRGVMQKVWRKISREQIFSLTGIQFLELNTIYQLAALAERNPGLLHAAGTLLPLADLVAYFLTGRAVSERTLASTTQVLDARTGRWSTEIIEALDLPEGIFGEIVEPGSVLGPLRDSVRTECDLPAPPPVIAVGSHDTASAVAAVPATGDVPWSYLSSGTWSLMGVELREPCLSAEALEANFTNEAGVASTTRFLRNINGLWLVQECRREWARRGEDLDYATLARLAEEAPSGGPVVDPGAPEFFSAGDMPRKIQEACRRAGGKVPQSKGEIVRSALDSLVDAYRAVFESAAAITGERPERLHVVGGGSRHRLLNQLTASALGIPVLAGPAEATAMGNILVQAMATGDVEDLGALRAVVRASTTVEEFRP